MACQYLISLFLFLASVLPQSLYVVSWLLALPFMRRILDNLPLVVPIKRPDQEDSYVYQLGFHVGLKGQYSGVCLLFYSTMYLILIAKLFLCLNCLNLQSKEEKYFIHNHLAFTVKYHKDPVTESARIVGFEVKPFRSLFLSPT